MSLIPNPAELRRRGLEILVRELGYVNAMRLLLQYETGQGDYTRDRDQILSDWSVTEMVREADKLVR
ncbi:MAG TPA: hypothetical protein PLL20_02835 [Phycisphaerae bacterium]|nr:hypothetical protein [Phycisphaerae bacterium]HRR86182.1 hypothetical protein [Phycisphaerae bacterium]